MKTRSAHIVALVIAMFLALVFSGCSALRMLGGAAFTRAELSDLVLEGIAGKTRPLTADLGGVGLPESVLGSIPDEEGLSLGLLLPVYQIGETSPLWVLCTGEFVTVASKIPEHAQVRVWGKPLLPTGFILPSRIVSPDIQD